MNGILSALRGYLRDAAPGGVLNPEVTLQGILDSAAISSMVVPGVGDVAGLLADLNRYRTDPGSRTPGNFALTGIGMLPLVPSLTVWHGSPHRFKPTPKNPLGEFDPTKIGSGEGAQARGYGHYVAEEPEVGGSYRTVRDTGQTFKLTPELKAALNEVDKFGYDSYNEALTHLWQNQSVNWDGIDVGARRVIEDWVKNNPYGYLYKADLADEAIPKMLDLDKPLSQQPESVRKALEPLIKGAHWEPPRGDSNWALKDGNGRTILWRSAREGGGGDVREFFDKMSGETIYSTLIGGKTKADTSNRLREMGILGNVYLDAGSRGAGQGTRNFVVYPGNEGILNILDVE